MMDYGKCSNCGCNLEPVWFIEEETLFSNGLMRKTRRKRRACSHLVCPDCGVNEVVDGSFDGAWY